MRELRSWCMIALAIVALWCGLFFLIRFIAPIPADEPPEAFGAGGMEFIPILFVLGCVTTGFSVAAFIRALFVARDFIAKSGRFISR